MRSMPQEKPDVKLYRSASPKKRLSSDETQLILMRHREFRKAPNPTRDKFEAYNPVISAVVHRFYSTNRKWCLKQGLEVDDLKTYAMVWTVNYCGLYEKPNPEKLESLLIENKKLLYTHLWQRFTGKFGFYYKLSHSKSADLQFPTIPLNTTSI